MPLSSRPGPLDKLFPAQGVQIGLRLYANAKHALNAHNFTNNVHAGGRPLQPPDCLGTRQVRLRVHTRWYMRHPSAVLRTRSR